MSYHYRELNMLTEIIATIEQQKAELERLPSLLLEDLPNFDHRSTSYRAQCLRDRWKFYMQFLGLILFFFGFLTITTPLYAESCILKQKAAANWHDCIRKPQTTLYGKANLKQVPWNPKLLFSTYRYSYRYYMAVEGTEVLLVLNAPLNCSNLKAIGRLELIHGCHIRSMHWILFTKTINCLD
ncbi:hypothetical protein TI05_06950 [Achromatium sp. WMS3]|nr:hypothetical protein TI05_06950 [Achromatium sp. WMS3]